ncbi:MAG: aminotransferase class V-fold PLP-dependent enzyme [Alphaproteobacteria bacterium]|nr:aminotransferase class V-fold PLP-dependent enzyme [Alphaproteobacteria bacterium]
MEQKLSSSIDLSTLNANFASGPCAKRKGWMNPGRELLGRSHRSQDGLERIQQTIQLIKKVLQIPDEYLVGFISGSNTGAMETLLWTLLGERGVDTFAGCVFGKAWTHDIVNELKLKDVRIFESQFPNLCKTNEIDADRDLVFCLTSTTSGASYKNLDWISDNRNGLTICDATSSVFCHNIYWGKLDATAFSWQKGIGGEAGIGTIVINRRTIARLESYQPSWPIPRIFRIASNKEVNFKIFEGCTINTPSMMCMEDFFEALAWADSIGGLNSLVRKVEENYVWVSQWVEQQSLFRFLVDENERAHNIACFVINDERYQALSKKNKWDLLKKVVKICDEEGSGHDFLGHIATEPHLRVWIGPTIDIADIAHFLPRMERACRIILNDLR